MKKIIGIMFTAVMVLLLLSSCGIPQEEHDTVLAERDTAQAEVASLQSGLAEVQSDLATAESDLADAESDLATAQNQVSSLQSDLTAAQSKVSDLEGFKTEFDSLWDSLHKKIIVRADLTSYWNYAALVTSDELSWAAYDTLCLIFYATMGAKVDTIGNTELSQLWQDVALYEEQGEGTLMMAKLGNFGKLLNTLILEDIAAIEAKLSE